MFNNNNFSNFNNNDSKYKFKYPSPADFSNYYLYKTTKFQPHVLINDLPSQQSTKYSNHTIEDLKSENSKANERNNKYHQNLIDNAINHYEKFQSSKKIKPSVLEYPKLTLKNYLYDNYPIDLQKNIDQRILDKQSELIATKAILENQLLKNDEMFQIENEYCSKMQNINEELLNKIRELNDKNNEIIKQRKKLLKDYNNMEQQIHFTLNAIMKKKEEEEEENVIINEPVEINNNSNTEILKSKAKIEDSFETDVEIKEKKKKYKLIKEKIYELNMNHKPGPLDKIRKKKLEEDLKKEEEELKKMIEIKKKQKDFSKPIIKKEVITFEHDLSKGNVVDLNDSKNIIDNKMSIFFNKDNNDEEESENKIKNSDNNINIISDHNIDNNSESNSNIFTKSQIKNNANFISNENTIENKNSSNYINVDNNDDDDNFDDNNFDDDNNVDNNDDYPDLDTKKISINEKEKVLENIINRINLYSAQIKDPNFKIYTQETIKEINDIKKNKNKIKNLFYKIKENPDCSIEMEVLPILIFEIVNTNYDLNINEQKLVLKSNYDENDFLLDLSDDYKNIIHKVIGHLRKMIVEDRCNINVGTMFLCKAVCNFPYDETMLNTLYLVIEKILKNFSISLEKE